MPEIDWDKAFEEGGRGSQSSTVDWDKAFEGGGRGSQSSTKVD